MYNYLIFESILSSYLPGRILKCMEDERNSGQIRVVHLGDDRLNRNYRDKKWIEFRESIFEMGGYSCVKCKRTPPEVVLQVHHKYYVCESAWLVDPPPESNIDPCHNSNH